MTQERKQLLLTDLCARLPYSTFVKYIVDDEDRDDILRTYMVHDLMYNLMFESPWLTIKPYLRPMSSMTEKEKHDLLKFGSITTLSNGEVIDVACVGFERHADVQDYLNSHHFDYRGLIPMGLAIKATEGMYKTE